MRTRVRLRLSRIGVKLKRGQPMRRDQARNARPLPRGQASLAQVMIPCPWLNEDHASQGVGLASRACLRLLGWSVLLYYDYFCGVSKN